MSELRIEPGEDLARAVADAPPGAVLVLSPGRYPARLVVERDVTLRGDGGEVVLDGEERGGVVAVYVDDVTVTLEGLTVTGGSAPQGGAVALAGMSRVELRGCVLRGNVGRQGPGGAIYAEQGTVALERCRVEDNLAPDGAAAFIDGIASLRASASLLTGQGGAGDGVVCVRDGADAALVGTTIVAGGSAAALSAAGTTSRQPEIEVTGSVLVGSPAIAVPTPNGARVTVARSVLHTAAGGFIGEAGVRLRDPGFVGSGHEPYRPAPGSPAVGLAAGGGVDLTGRERPSDAATAGALEVE